MIEDKPSRRNAIYFIVFLIVVGLFYVITPREHFQPVGILLPLVTVKPLTAQAKVSLYQHEPYQAFKLIGHVNLEASTQQPTHAQELAMLDYAKSLARQGGANALVMNEFGYQRASADSPSSNLILFASAIKI